MQVSLFSFALVFVTFFATGKDYSSFRFPYQLLPHFQFVYISTISGVAPTQASQSVHYKKHSRKTTWSSSGVNTGSVLSKILAVRKQIFPALLGSLEGHSTAVRGCWFDVLNVWLLDNSPSRTKAVLMRAAHPGLSHLWALTGRQSWTSLRRLRCPDAPW